MTLSPFLLIDWQEQHEWVSPSKKFIEWLKFSCIESIRMIKNKKTKERRYFISSLKSKPDCFNHLIRSHWGLGSVHWILDVSFREDAQKTKTGHLPENLSLIWRLSLNFLRQGKTSKVGIEIKRQKAGWDNDYLLKVLGVKFFS